MILGRLTEAAEAAAQRYTLLTEAWRGLFATSISASDFGAPSLTSRAIDSAYALASQFLSDERQRIADLTFEIATEARQQAISDIRSNDTTELTEPALEHLRETQRYMSDELVAQVHRDIAQLRQGLQRVSLEVSLASRSRGISTRSALLEYRIGNSADLQFMFFDRQGRKWSSKKFIRAVWRHTLLSVYNEMILMSAADHGLSRVKVVHQDAKSDVHGTIVALGSNSEFVTYSEIRNEVFHPNANSVLKVELPHVSP